MRGIEREGAAESKRFLAEAAQLNSVCLSGRCPWQASDCDQESCLFLPSERPGRCQETRCGYHPIRSLSRQNTRKVSIEIRQVFFEPHPADVTIRTDQHAFTLPSAIRGGKMAKCVHVNFGAGIRLLRRTHIDAFHATPLSPAHRPLRSKQPQQGKMRASKDIEQPYGFALGV